MHLKSKPLKNRRHYFLNFYGELLQADLGVIFEFDNFKYFLLVIDCYSLKIKVKCLKNKQSETVLNAFTAILDDFNTEIYKVETDQGTEFSLVKNFCKKNHIIFKYKFGANKANFSEWGILIIKKRLYKMMRGTFDKNWPDLITKVVEDHNNTPQKKIGYLTPNQINNPYDSAKVREQLKKYNFESYSEPNFFIQNKNQEDFKDTKHDINVLDYVYVDFKQDLFSKSFDVQVSFYI